MEYLVFAGERFYARGGANDLLKAFTSEEDALKFAKEIVGGAMPGGWGKYEWSQVLKVKGLIVIYESDGKPYGG